VNKNFPCSCGHKYKQHVKGIELGYPNEPPYAWVSQWLHCTVDDQTRVGIKNCRCTCHNFMPDNLKYIEGEFKRKK
jgi:hypothetical protein